MEWNGNKTLVFTHLHIWGLIEYEGVTFWLEPGTWLRTRSESGDPEMELLEGWRLILRRFLWGFSKLEIIK